MLGDLVRSACGLRGGEPLDGRQGMLRARVAERVPAAEGQRVTEFLGEVIGALFPDAESPSLLAARQDAQLMSDEMRAAFRDFH